MIDLGEKVAFRKRPTSTIRAVKNVWYERVFVHARHYKRFYIAFSVILAVVVSLVAVLPGLVHHGLYQSAAVPIETANIPSQSRTVAASKGPSETVPSSESSEIHSSAAGAPGAITRTTPTPSETCIRSGFTANASWVGAYNPKVNPPQFQIVGSRDAGGCCRHCFGLPPPLCCNGWGYINSICSIVYDYPGAGADPTCPKGRPLVGISPRGGMGDFAGLGPCATAD